MRELHVVALSEDGRHVVLATRAGAASGEFRVALDERLTAAVRGELPAPGRDAPPSISPREIQARLRDGEAPEEIAASAGVPLSRVERYAGPVLAELDRTITGARAAVVHRPRLGASALPLGEAVEAHLAEVAHLAAGSTRWSARRTDQGHWVVQVSWTARGRRRSAGWHYDPATRQVVAVDGPSAVLGHVETAAAPPAPARSARPAARGAGHAGTATGTARPSGGAPAGGRAVPAPAAATSPTPRPAPAASAGASSQPAPRPTAGAGGTGRAATSRSAVPAPAPPRTTRTAAPPAAAPPARRRPATAAATASTAAPTPAAATRTRPAAATTRPTPAPDAPSPSVPAVVAATTRAARRSSGRTAAGRPTTADASPGQGNAATGPPVLRVVPPTDPEPAQDGDDTAAETRPVRRAAGQRTGGRDWADVLMGAAPATRAAPDAAPRQDEQGRS